MAMSSNTAARQRERLLIGSRQRIEHLSAHLRHQCHLSSSSHLLHLSTRSGAEGIRASKPPKRSLRYLRATDRLDLKGTSLSRLACCHASGAREAPQRSKQIPAISQTSWTSVGVVAGVGMVAWTGWQLLDPIVAGSSRPTHVGHRNGHGRQSQSLPGFRCQGDHPARHRRAEVRRRSSEKNSPVELEILWVV